VSRRVVRLVERRTRVVKLPRADADFLLTHARHVVEVLPGGGGGVYRVTPRGVVGFLDTPRLRLDIRPKIPWPNLRMLLGLEPTSPPGGDAAEAGGGLLAVFARDLAERIRAVVAAGLVRGYRDADTDSPFLRGRLRTADHLRDAAARAFPSHFPITESVFDLDTPWNRVPKATAATLLARPDLPAAARADLAAAVEPLESVPAGRLAEADFAAVAHDPRAAGYNGLIALCRQLTDGLAAGSPLGTDGGGFLLDLGRVFETYLSRSITAHFAGRPGWTVEAQPRVVVGHLRSGPVELQPDLIVRRRGAVRAVLDAKWKRPGPDPADLHQILAYAVATGAARVGLVYPGRRYARHDLTTPDGRVRVSLYRAAVVGPAAACEGSVARLARSLVRVRPA